LADWGGLYSKFNGEEKENIKKGTIAEGMSKEAVLMAYGYPPSHRTAALASDEWAYWIADLPVSGQFFRITG